MWVLAAASALVGAGWLTVAIFGPLAVLFGGWLGYQIGCNRPESAREREFLRKLAWRIWLFSGFFLLVLFTGVYFEVAGTESHAARLVEPFEIFCGAYGVALSPDVGPARI